MNGIIFCISIKRLSWPARGMMRKPDEGVFSLKKRGLLTLTKSRVNVILKQVFKKVFKKVFNK